MRGKGHLMMLVERSGGITPAYAGKRAIWKSLSSPRKDHPRLCGEKQIDEPIENSETGSPPPMRGKD